MISKCARGNPLRDAGARQAGMLDALGDLVKLGSANEVRQGIPARPHIRSGERRVRACAAAAHNPRARVQREPFYSRAQRSLHGRLIPPMATDSRVSLPGPLAQRRAPLHRRRRQARQQLVAATFDTVSSFAGGHPLPCFAQRPGNAFPDPRQPTAAHRHPSLLSAPRTPACDPAPIHTRHLATARGSGH